MSITQTLVLLTVLEILALVGVLALYLIAVTRRLRSIAANLARVAFGVRAVEVQTDVIGPGVTAANRTLADIRSTLPGLAEKAERLASR